MQHAGGWDHTHDEAGRMGGVKASAHHVEEAARVHAPGVHAPAPHVDDGEHTRMPGERPTGMHDTSEGECHHLFVEWILER